VILVVDNYDSFTFNLVQALEAVGARTLVVRNDEIDLPRLIALTDDPAADLRGMVISPGPGDPSEAGISVAAIQLAARRAIPLLGVCLGMQSLAVAFGGRIVRAPTLVHGEASLVEHDGAGLLAGLPRPFAAGRYHSLCVDRATLPDDLVVTAVSPSDGVIMGLRHRHLPLEGVQFHPESVLTPEGPRLLANFLRRAAEGEAERLAAAAGRFAIGGLSAGPAEQGERSQPVAGGAAGVIR
jgi:para-aminobenzoate synthetase component 2